MVRNFVIALTIVGVSFAGFGAATQTDALTAGDVQAQITKLQAQIAELTARLNLLKSGQASSDPVSPTFIGSSMPAKHRICDYLTRNLTPGSLGEDVRSLQQFLYENKTLTVAPTGYFGDLTKQAVMKWQAQEGVSAVGSFGPLSRERIKIWCGGFENKERFAANPSRGEAPLTVLFDTWISGFRDPSTYYVIDFGDGSNERAANCSAMADACTAPGQNSHTYTENGTYTATLSRVTDPCYGQPACKAAIHSEIVAKQQIVVGSQVACTKEYRPVCGAKPIVCITTPCNPIPTTYGNSCMMKADGATLLYEGQCRTEHPQDNPQCKSWFDGCNSCSRETPGGMAACTLKYCAPETMQKPYCTAYFNSGNKAPTISGISGPTKLNEDVQGTWTVNAKDAEGDSLSYQVWWGDENVYAQDLTTAARVAEYAQNASFTHIYSNPGTYVVTVVVRDSAGNEAKSTISVTVERANVVCTAIYQPVCGRPSGCANTCAPGQICPAICQLHTPQTYSNRCMLDGAGAQYLHEGECTASSGNWY